MKPKAILNLPDDWAADFDMRMLNSQIDTSREKAYICSPCRAKSSFMRRANMMAARYYMYYAFTHMGLCPCAPHAALPTMLNDEIERERDLALKFGLEMLTISDRLLVCGHVLTDGMRGEIRKAKELSIPITVFSADLYEEVKSIAGDWLVRFDSHEHISMVMMTGELFEF